MLLQKKEKERSKKLQTRDILQMFIDVVDELLRRCYDMRSDEPAAEMEQFRRYTNRCFRSIAKQYQSQTAGLILPTFDSLLWTRTNNDFYKIQMTADDIDIKDDQKYNKAKEPQDKDVKDVKGKGKEIISLS